MKKDWIRFRKRKNARGQVLILAVFAMIVLVTVLILLFDIHQVIRRKVMVMSGVDAAALTGAIWQKHSLNLIGEMNLIKACTVLISDSIYGVGKNPNDFMRASIDANSTPEQIASEVAKAKAELELLKTAADMLTEMQVRVAFVGPLIGFGAAQQAAKNNGMPPNQSCNAYLRDLYDLVLDEDVYGNPRLAPQVYYEYAWRAPYARMLYSLLGAKEKGLAVGTNVKHIGMPGFLSDTLPGRSLDKKIVMDAIAANVSANLLGLGNAATPPGLEAARRLHRGGSTAGDSLCMLVVCNTASIQLIPTTVAAVRSGAGSTAPFDILPAVWLSSVCPSA